MISINNTLFIGKVLYELDAIGSTNQYALDLLSKSKPSEGTIVLTHDQYSGKGQGGNIWESAPYQNLTFTLILYPTFLAARQQFLLSQAVSLAILRTIQSFIPKKCTIKWPNDLYVENRKITGILIQNSLKGTSLQSSVVGIGLNVNQRTFESNSPNPTSIFLETDTEFNLQSILQKLCQELERHYLLLRSAAYPLIQEQYQQQLFRFDEYHIYKKNDGTTIEGKIVGVTKTGLLRLQTEQREEKFDLKEIRYII